MTDRAPGIDLHLHSLFSDGELTPEQLVEEAQWCGLGAMALTDHDSCEGVERAQAAGSARGIEVIAGVELSCEFNGQEAHILGLLLEPNEMMNAELLRMRQNRESRMERMLERLGGFGLRVSMDELPSTGGQSIGRPHLARLLVQKGYVRSPAEAFERYIGDHGPGYIAKERWSVEKGLEMIRAAHGVSILAHPGASGLIPWLDEFAKLGVMGIEVHYPKHQPHVEQRLLDFCAANGLLVSGGSDFHSSSSGPGIGTPYIPSEILMRLKAKKEELWPVS